MIWSNPANPPLAAPVFHWIIAIHGVLAPLAVAVAIGIRGSISGGVFQAAIAETPPMSIRGLGFELIHATAITLLGGAAPLIVAWLTHVAGNPTAPAWCLFAVTLAGQIGLTPFKESAAAQLA
jgi:hypothetical protein